MALNWQLEFDQGWPDVPVCGVDEAGRGPWAGPVTAAAIVLPAGFDLGVDDSKKLTEKTRERLFDDLLRLPHGIGFASVEEIDEMNILQATFLAMRRAVEAMSVTPAYILVDGNRLPAWDYPSQAIIGGDGVSPSIAAASILAKVARDRLMRQLHEAFPQYGWASNKGYGAKAHSEGLAQHGVSPHHRKSYAPIRKILGQE